MHVIYKLMLISKISCLIVILHNIDIEIFFIKTGKLLKR